MRKYYNGSIGVGGASLLLIFVLLSLTTFATLSLVSANADKGMVDRDAQAVTNYYAADSIAEEMLAKIGEIVAQTPPNGLVSALQAIQLENQLEIHLEEPILVKQELDGITIAYSLPVDQRRYLHVGLLIQDRNIKITEWRVALQQLDADELSTLPDEEDNFWSGETIIP